MYYEWENVIRNLSNCLVLVRTSVIYLHSNYYKLSMFVLFACLVDIIIIIKTRTWI